MEIEKLRKAKEQKGYTYQRIVDESEKLGNAVSLSTVKRVFAPGAKTRLTVDRETAFPSFSDSSTIR